MKTSLITSRDEKGRHTVNLFAAAYDNAKLTEEEAQLLNERGGEFQEDALAVVRKYSSGVFRDTGELTIQIPALPRPTLAELQKDWSYIKSIERDTSPTEALTLKLATVLREKENPIGGTEYELRLKPKHGILLGFQHRQWLKEHQSEFPKLMALLGKIYIDFPGLVVVRARGSRVYPYLDDDGERWDGRWDWIDNGFDSFGRVASK